MIRQGGSDKEEVYPLVSVPYFKIERSFFIRGLQINCKYLIFQGVSVSPSLAQRAFICMLTIQGIKKCGKLRSNYTEFE